MGEELEAKFRDGNAGQPAVKKVVSRDRNVGVLARRIHGWSYQAFPIGMGTGAVYLTLASLTHQARWLNIIQRVLFFTHLVIFLVNCCTFAAQIMLYPKLTKRSLTDPPKSIFVPFFALNFATLLIGMTNYSVPSHKASPELIYRLFWVYIAVATIVSMGMLFVWFDREHDVRLLTPAWAFLVYPMMLTGVVGANVLKVLDGSNPRVLGVLFISYFFQGVGFFLAFFYLALYLLRITTTGLMSGQQANSAFVACGPPGFTGVAIVNLGSQASTLLPKYGLLSDVGGEVWYAAGALGGLMLFGLAVFFFVFSALPYWYKVDKHRSSILGAWALTFPNVGWITLLSLLGKTLGIPFLFVVHDVIAVMMFITWIGLVVLTCVAFWKGEILEDEAQDVVKDMFERRHAGDHQWHLHEHMPSWGHRHLEADTRREASV